MATLEYERGYNDARQLWPEPISDRPPTATDSDEYGQVQVLTGDQWDSWHWIRADGFPWLHTPRWKAKEPTLQEQAFACLDELAKDEPGYWKGIDTIRRALEQAGEAQQ